MDQIIEMGLGFENVIVRKIINGGVVEFEIGMTEEKFLEKLLADDGVQEYVPGDVAGEMIEKVHPYAMKTLRANCWAKFAAQLYPAIPWGGNYGELEEAAELAAKKADALLERMEERGFFK